MSAFMWPGGEISPFHCPLWLPLSEQRKRGSERERERVTDHIHHSLFYVWTACVCVSVCECTRSPLMLKHIVHAVLICDPTLLTAPTSPANHPGADGTGIYMYVYLCVSVCVLACVNALQQYNETADPQVTGPRQA